MALILVTDWNITGALGILVAALIATPINIILGYAGGAILNRAKGREMITSYILGFFMSGVYQLTLLYCMGTIIPVESRELVLSRGFGIRNAIQLLGIKEPRQVLGISLKVAGVEIPSLTFVLIAIICIFNIWIRKTKLGQEIRAVGQDMEVARTAGINVEKTRIISMILSTVLAGYGQLIYIQNRYTSYV